MTMYARTSDRDCDGGFFFDHRHVVAAVHPVFCGG